jgi:hypothetical protein
MITNFECSDTEIDLDFEEDGGNGHQNLIQVTRVSELFRYAYGCKGNVQIVYGVIVPEKMMDKNSMANIAVFQRTQKDRNTPNHFQG